MFFLLLGALALYQIIPEPYNTHTNHTVANNLIDKLAYYNKNRSNIMKQYYNRIEDMRCGDLKCEYYNTYSNNIDNNYANNNTTNSACSIYVLYEKKKLYINEKKHNRTYKVHYLLPVITKNMTHYDKYKIKYSYKTKKMVFYKRKETLWSQKTKYLNDMLDLNDCDMQHININNNMLFNCLILQEKNKIFVKSHVFWNKL